MAPILLLPGLVSFKPHRALALWSGWLVGTLSIGVGIAGLIWHLRGTFFLEQTLHNLVYTAPFAAPLSYAGLGFLLLLNRTEDPRRQSYGQWILVLAAGGFAGNFALTLADHAQNGFFHSSEWFAVLAAAFGFSFLLVASYASRDREMLRACGWMMAAQVLVGLLGAGLHVRAILAGPSASLLNNAIHTAPLFAPLLFADLAILGGIGLWCCASASSEGDQAVSGDLPAVSLSQAR